MFKYILIIFISLNCHAFLDAIATAGKETAEAAAVLGATASLLEETEVAARQVKNLKELQDQIDNMNRQLNEVKDLTDDTKKIIQGQQYSSVNDLTTNIRYATEYIRTVKKVLLTVGILSPAAQTSINTMTTNNLLTKVVDNQNAEAIERAREQTDKQRRRLNMYKGIKTMLDNKSKFAAESKSYAADLAVRFFDTSVGIMFILLPIIFFGKVVFSNFFGSAEDHFENLKTLVMYFVIIFGFKLILPYLIDLPHIISETYNTKFKVKYDDILNAYVVSENKSAWSFDVLAMITGLVHILEAIVQVVVDMMFVLLSLLAPIIIMLSVMLNLGVGVKLLFGLLFIMGTWNVAIAACEILLKEVALNKTWESNMFIMALITASMKIIAGATNILLVLKSQAGGGMGKSLGMMKSSVMNMGARGLGIASPGGGSNLAYNTAGTSLDDKLSRMAPSTQAGTFAGIGKAENAAKRQEAFKADMKQARKNLGIDKPKNASNGKNNNSKNDPTQKSDSKLENNQNSTGGSSSINSQSQDNSDVKLESANENSMSSSSSDSDSASKINPASMDYQEAGSWTKDSSNFDNLSNDELRGAMHSFDGMAKQQNKIGDEESAAWKRPEGDYGDTPQTSGHRAATEYASARDRVGYALQNRKQKEHSTDSDDALQSGHMDKKKGRK